MSKVKCHLFKSYNWLIAGILALLGFGTSCSGTVGGMPVEYGSPSANYKINGNITSAVTDQPINNIKVVMKIQSYETDTSYFYYPVDSTFSDENGAYSLATTDYPDNPKTFRFIFSDIDSTENGSFQDLDTIVSFDEITYSGASGWYQGEATLNSDIKLKPKE